MSKNLDYLFKMDEFIKLFEPGELTTEQETRLYEFAKEFDLTINDITEFQKLKEKQNDQSRT